MPMQPRPMAETSRPDVPSRRRGNVVPVDDPVIRTLPPQSYPVALACSCPSAMDNPFEMALSPGSRLGPYEILAPLGEGGMGAVYRARDPRLGREVAIKTIHERRAGDPQARTRFTREAR